MDCNGMRMIDTLVQRSVGCEVRWESLGEVTIVPEEKPHCEQLYLCSHLRG